MTSDAECHQLAGVTPSTEQATNGYRLGFPQKLVSDNPRSSELLFLYNALEYSLEMMFKRMRNLVINNKSNYHKRCTKYFNSV